MADVQRVLKIREDKPALQNLLQKGSVGDDVWNSLLAAERELEGEIMEVMAEANTFVDGWGQIIFQTANEMIANEKMRALFEQTSDLRKEKELKYGKSKPTKAIDAQIPTPQAISSSLAALPNTPIPVTSKPPNGAMPSSKADAVTPISPVTPATPTTPATPVTPSKSSGKKGKKRK
jgi:translocation protein SEC66